MNWLREHWFTLFAIGFVLGAAPYLVAAYRKIVMRKQ